MEKLKKLGKLSKLSKIIGLILFALIFFGTGYLVGHKNLTFEANLKPVILNKELVKPRSVDFGIFWKAWDLVNEKFAAGTLDSQKMVYGAISGMVDSLGDPYTIFMEPTDSKTFIDDLSGEIQGIGAEISTKDKQIVIVSPLADSPAEKAGLEPLDQIVKIDDQFTDGLSVEEAVAKIRGKAGTVVKLTILRDGWTESKVFSITREKITIKSVEWSMKDGNIAYIRVSQFGEDTTKLMENAARDIAAKNASAVILDLRHNPGGYLQSAVDMVGIFTDKGTVVVKEKDKTAKINEEKTTQDPILKNVKLLVLTDEGSASASEIVAGALQDLSRAKLVGEKTFGKGSVQGLEDLGNGATLKMTIAEWLTPNDRAINHKGIEPDAKIGLTEDDVKAGRDSQLDKAMELAK